MFIFLKKRKKCHDSYIISQQKARNHIANEIVQRNTLNRSTVQNRKSINDRISLKIRTASLELIEIDFVSFSDDEFVIGPCRSTATHDNDRK